MYGDKIRVPHGFDGCQPLTFIIPISQSSILAVASLPYRQIPIPDKPELKIDDWRLKIEDLWYRSWPS
jgi:hypothetical protein